MHEKELYEEILSKIRELIEGHKTAQIERASIKGFAEAYGLSRQNLQEIFSGRQVMSLGLFIRITTALGLETSSASYGEEALRMSLRLYLEMQPPQMLTLIRVALT